ANGKDEILDKLEKEDWENKKDDFVQTVWKAVDDFGQNQVIARLRNRKQRHRFHAACYTALANVLVDRNQEGDITNAFQVLIERIENVFLKPEYLIKAHQDLFEFCKKHDRLDLAHQGYEFARNKNIDVKVLREYEKFIDQFAIAENNQPREHHGVTGLFIDHENFFKSLEEANEKRGGRLEDDSGKCAWFSDKLERLLNEIMRRFGKPAYKVSVAFWDRSQEAQHLPAYVKNRFVLRLPASVPERKQENAVDFMLADEIRRAQLQAMKEGSRLDRILIVAGDVDYAHIVSNLADEGLEVQIWGFREPMSFTYRRLIGQENVVIIDEICGFA
ncbi:NYN domain-containing protein, partial [bacterium]|nr:NYN domain-containing protein [bacterium]